VKLSLTIKYGLLKILSFLNKVGLLSKVGIVLRDLLYNIGAPDIARYCI
jgi:hypothetical protein